MFQKTVNFLKAVETKNHSRVAGSDTISMEFCYRWNLNKCRLARLLRCLIRMIHIYSYKNVRAVTMCALFAIWHGNFMSGFFKTSTSRKIQSEFRMIREGKLWKSHKDRISRNKNCPMLFLNWMWTLVFTSYQRRRRQIQSVFQQFLLCFTSSSLFSFGFLSTCLLVNKFTANSDVARFFCKAPRQILL